MKNRHIKIFINIEKSVTDIAVKNYITNQYVVLPYTYPVLILYANYKHKALKRPDSFSFIMFLQLLKTENNLL